MFYAPFKRSSPDLSFCILQRILTPMSVLPLYNEPPRTVISKFVCKMLFFLSLFFLIVVVVVVVVVVLLLLLLSLLICRSIIR